MSLLNYQDTATFYKVTSDEYGRRKIITETESVPVIFLQGIRLVQGDKSETVQADAICYPDPTNDFVIDNANRLEGMFILAPLFGVDSEEGWYRISQVTVNRDHLLTNQIDNIMCVLTKASKLINAS